MTNWWLGLFPSASSQPKIPGPAFLRWLWSLTVAPGRRWTDPTQRQNTGTKMQTSKHSHACCSLSVHGGLATPWADHIWGQTRTSDHRHCSRLVLVSRWVACSELLTAELLQWGWLCFDNWEILYTEMMFSGMHYLPQLFSPGRGDLTENSPSKSKGKRMWLPVAPIHAWNLKGLILSFI